MCYWQLVLNPLVSLNASHIHSVLSSQHATVSCPDKMTVLLMVIIFVIAHWIHVDVFFFFFTSPEGPLHPVSATEVLGRCAGSLPLPRLAVPWHALAPLHHNHTDDHYWSSDCDSSHPQHNPKAGGSLLHPAHDCSSSAWTCVCCGGHG